MPLPFQSVKLCEFFRFQQEGLDQTQQSRKNRGKCWTRRYIKTHYIDMQIWENSGIHQYWGGFIVRSEKPTKGKHSTPIQFDTLSVSEAAQPMMPMHLRYGSWCHHRCEHRRIDTEYRRRHVQANPNALILLMVEGKAEKLWTWRVQICSTFFRKASLHGIATAAT